MDWIEKLFGIEPDLGSGSLELMIAGAVVAVVAGVVVSRRTKRRESEERR